MVILVAALLLTRINYILGESEESEEGCAGSHWSTHSAGPLVPGTSGPGPPPLSPLPSDSPHIMHQSLPPLPFPHQLSQHTHARTHSMRRKLTHTILPLATTDSPLRRPSIMSARIKRTDSPTAATLLFRTSRVVSFSCPEVALRATCMAEFTRLDAQDLHLLVKCDGNPVGLCC